MVIISIYIYICVRGCPWEILGHLEGTSNGTLVSLVWSLAISGTYVRKYLPKIWSEIWYSPSIFGSCHSWFGFHVAICCYCYWRPPLARQNPNANHLRGLRMQVWMDVPVNAGWKAGNRCGSQGFSWNKCWLFSSHKGIIIHTDTCIAFTLHYICIYIMHWHLHIMHIHVHLHIHLNLHIPLHYIAFT